MLSLTCICHQSIKAMVRVSICNVLLQISCMAFFDLMKVGTAGVFFEAAMHLFHLWVVCRVYLWMGGLHHGTHQ